MTRAAPHPPDAQARVHPAQRFRAMAPGVAALETALSRRVDALALAAGPGTTLVTLGPPLPADPAGPWLTLHLGGAPATVGLPWSLAARIAGQPLDGGDPRDAALVIEDALAATLDAAEAALGLQLRLDTLSDSAPDALPLAALPLAALPPPALPIARTLRIDGAFSAVALPLRLSEQAAARLAAALSSRPVRLADASDLPLVIGLALGMTRLTRGELASLAPGDALLLPRGAEPMQALVVGHLSAAVEPCALGVRMTTPFQPLPSPDKECPPMPADPAPADAAPSDPAVPTGASPPAPQALVDDIEVQVTFLSGQALIPLRDLRSMAPGSVVPLPLPADATVRIVVNGRAIGTGELIDVGGARAVQIRSIFADE